MKNNSQVKKERGFALLEVMIAALILTVGSVAYMKLQRMSLQYGFNNATRTQGTAIVENFVEQLRSNVSLIRTSVAPISGSFLGGSVAAPAANINCNSSTNTQSCAQAIFSMHSFLTSEQMSRIAPDNNTRLCYTESTTEAGLIRVTFEWIDNSRQGQAISFVQQGAACPTFNATIQQNNSVTIYAQI